MILGILITIIYIYLSGILGKAFLDRLNISIFNNSFSDYLVGFLTVEILCFAFFMIGSGFLKLPFWFNFFPLIILGIWYLSTFGAQKGIRIKGVVNQLWPVLVVFLCLCLVYLYEAETNILAAIFSEGVIYQDVIYHSGISNGMIEFGYPVPDLQISGSLIRYHFFTHFMAAQWSFLSGLQTFQVYIILFYFVFSFFASFLMFDLVKIILKKQYTGSKYLIIALITFFGIFLLGGNLSMNSMAAYYFSYSYQWQLVLILVIVGAILGKLDSDYEFKNYIVLLVLFLTSVLVKGSSLPLLLTGFGCLFLHRMYNVKRIIISDIFFICISLVMGLITYKLFFSAAFGEGIGGRSYLDSFGYNEKWPNKTLLSVILKKINIEFGGILILGLLISVVSYRIYLLKFFKNILVTFSLGMFLIGILFFLFYLNDSLYFLLPTIFIANFVMLVYFVRDHRTIPIFAKVIFSFLVVFSIYPISSFGFAAKRKIIYKNQEYYPITNNRIELFDYIHENTGKDEIIFTTSLYGSGNSTADNFYPAVQTKRNFYLGGYRFYRGKKSENFEERKSFVENFDLFSEDDIEFLKMNNLQYILIEFVGSDYPLKSKLTKTINESQSIYKILFSNNDGMVIKLL